MIAAQTATPSPSPVLRTDIDPASVIPGPVAGAFFLFLLVAGFLLWRSMNKQIGRISPDVPNDGRPSRRTIPRADTMTPPAGGVDPPGGPPST